MSCACRFIEALLDWKLWTFAVFAAFNNVRPFESSAQGNIEITWSSTSKVPNSLTNQNSLIIKSLVCISARLSVTRDTQADVLFSSTRDTKHGRPPCWAACQAWYVYSHVPYVVPCHFLTEFLVGGNRDNLDKHLGPQEMAEPSRLHRSRLACT